MHTYWHGNTLLCEKVCYKSIQYDTIQHSVFFGAGRKSEGGGRGEGGERGVREGKGGTVKGDIPMLNMGHGIMNKFYY